MNLPPYLTRIEGPPPKRNVVSSSLAGGATNAVNPKVCGVFLCCDEAQLIGWDSATVNRQKKVNLLTGLEPFPSLFGLC